MANVSFTQAIPKHFSFIAFTKEDPHFSLESWSSTSFGEEKLRNTDFRKMFWRVYPTWKSKGRKRNSTKTLSFPNIVVLSSYLEMLPKF